MYRMAITCLLALLAIPVGAQHGMNVLPDTAPDAVTTQRSLRFGSADLRMDLSVSHPGTSLARTLMLGHYYLTGPGFGGDQVSGGLRITSGLSIGPHETTTPLPPTGLGGGLQWGSRQPGPHAIDRHGAQLALPYIGLGYSSLSAREGWGLSADIGLGGQRPGDRVRFGDGSPTAAQVESVLNELRLAPVIQFGVSYAF